VQYKEGTKKKNQIKHLFAQTVPTELLCFGPMNIKTFVAKTDLIKQKLCYFNKLIFKVLTQITCEFLPLQLC
jgi:hypothetical protein